MANFDNETFEGAEAESGEPTDATNRSAFATLAALGDDPLAQAGKLVKYVKSSRERVAKLTKVCSPATLDIIAKHYPGVL